MRWHHWSTRAWSSRDLGRSPDSGARAATVFRGHNRLMDKSTCYVILTVTGDGCTLDNRNTAIAPKRRNLPVWEHIQEIWLLVILKVSVRWTIDFQASISYGRINLQNQWRGLNSSYSPDRIDLLTVRARRCPRGAYRLPIEAMILGVLLEWGGCCCVFCDYIHLRPLITAENSSPCVRPRLHYSRTPAASD